MNKHFIDRSKLDVFLRAFAESRKANGSYFQTIHHISIENYLDLLREIGVVFFYWKSSSISFLGIDQLRTIKNSYPSLNPLKRLVRENNIYFGGVEKEDFSTYPYAFGAKSFSKKMGILWGGFCQSEWFVPRVLFLIENEKQFLTVNVKRKTVVKDVKEAEKILIELSKQTSQKKSYIHAKIIQRKNEKKNWIKSVNKIIQYIQLLEVKKVVLSRRTKVFFNEHKEYSPSLSSILSRLKMKMEDGLYVFCFSQQNRKFFFGASPELLLSANGIQIKTESLAGTSFSEREIELNSSKNKIEHKIVTDFINKKLQIYCKKVTYEIKPNVRKNFFISHLRTQFIGELKEGINPIDLAESLHPTPAVCGDPHKKSYKLISQVETAPRGLYSGLLGWVSSNFSHLEMAVGIRSVLFFNERRALIFSGCGIVADSKPEDEFTEAELKMRMILSLFT